MNAERGAQTVLITGATDGLGKAAALLLAERGYRVFAAVSEGRHDRRADQQCGARLRWRRRGSAPGRLAAAIRNELLRGDPRDPGGSSPDARTPERAHLNDELGLWFCDRSKPRRLQRFETCHRSVKQRIAPRTLSFRDPHHSHPARLYHDQHSNYGPAPGPSVPAKIQGGTLRQES